MLSPSIASLHLSTRNPILSSAWAGPSIRMDEHEYRTYKLLKETIKRQDAEKRQAEKERRRAVKDGGVVAKAKRGLLKVVSGG
ncbi:MAG: hypothetical protein LQ339_001612 [Xanthoria mediterranea]|nr:MAG: hypothetical protein LQ339_001612 [Xanthoria mediterranea]